MLGLKTIKTESKTERNKDSDKKGHSQRNWKWRKGCEKTSKEDQFNRNRIIRLKW